MSKSIGYFGEEGSFTQLAAIRRFPTLSSEDFVSCSKLEWAFSKLQEGLRAIVVPIENASRGTITDTVDQLIRSAPTPQVRECLAMPIKLVLLTAGKRGIPSIIYSHEAALTHASGWLSKEYPQSRLVAVESTSAAALLVRNEPGTAALAGEQALGLYGLQILRDDVEEAIANRTKFYVIGQELADSQPPTHTSLIFEAAHRPGSLVAALKVLSDLGLNLTMIQSRPIPGRFDEYRFFIEFEGVPGTPKGDEALKGLKAATHSLNLLGSYPIVNLS